MKGIFFNVFRMIFFLIFLTTFFIYFNNIIFKKADFDIIHEKLSDHFPIVAILSLSE